MSKPYKLDSIFFIGEGGRAAFHSWSEVIWNLIFDAILAVLVGLFIVYMYTNSIGGTWEDFKTVMEEIYAETN